jgi:hypothetical protein
VSSRPGSKKREQNDQRARTDQDRAATKPQPVKASLFVGEQEIHRPTLTIAKRRGDPQIFRAEVHARDSPATPARSINALVQD